MLDAIQSNRFRDSLAQRVRNYLCCTFKRTFEKWFRRNWLSSSRIVSASADKQVAIAFVNYNTAELTSHLLFSLYRVFGKDKIARAVVVDNGSTDGSRQLLAAFSKAKLLDVIFSEKQHYNGSGLNIAMNYLARAAKDGQT